MKQMLFYLSTTFIFLLNLTVFSQNTFPSSGNVGIGTTSPQQALEVNGNINVGSNIQNTSTKNETYGSKLFFLGAHRNTDDLWIARYNVSGSPNLSEIRVNIGDDPTHFGDKFVIGATKSEVWYPRFIVRGDGYVGVGTTTPDSKLSVNGNIHTKEVKVDLSGWSDFVFEKGYELPTLEEVANHIAQQGHLKDIPSTAEVKENGILVGEMNAKLLQKIEELTLYLIAENKQNTKQQEVIQKQAQLIEKLEKRMEQLEDK